MHTSPARHVRGRVTSAFSSARGSRAVAVALVLGVVVLAVLSLAVGIGRATTADSGFYSTDFQWSPTRLFLDGVDPYQVRLSGGEGIILTQGPNYLHLLYVVLTPYGLLPFAAATWAWALTTTALAAGLGVFYARTAGWGWLGTIALPAVLIASTPFRLGLSNGQHAVLVLAAATVAYAARGALPAGAALALALTKYSFAPVALVALVRRRWAPVVIAGAVLLVAGVAFSLVTGTPPVQALVEPLLVSRGAARLGAADVMSVVALALGLDGSSLFLSGLAVVAALGLAVVSARAVRRGDWVFALAVAGVISLVTFKHLAHDLVFLLPAVVVLTRSSRTRVLAGWVALLHLWFVAGILSQLGVPNDNPVVIVVSFVALAVLLGVLLITDDLAVPVPAPVGAPGVSPTADAEPGQSRPAAAGEEPSSWGSQNRTAADSAVATAKPAGPLPST